MASDFRECIDRDEPGLSAATYGFRSGATHGGASGAYPDGKFPHYGLSNVTLFQRRDSTLQRMNPTSHGQEEKNDL